MNANPTPPPQTEEQDEASPSPSPSLQQQKRGEDELTSRVRQELAAEGVNFDDLLDTNSALQLTREKYDLIDVLETLPGDAPERSGKQTRLDEVRTELTRVRRQVMQPFLKKVFLVQSVLFALAGGVLSADPDVPLVGQALGFWMVWLFTIPSLRARKGIARWEKSALNIAFVATPLINLLMPFITKQCIIIWSADVTFVLACYAFYFQRAVGDVDLETDVEQAKIKGFLKYLDWGSWR